VKTPDHELTSAGDAQKLAQLARQNLHGEAPHRDATSFAKVGDKLARRRRNRRVRVLSSAVSALALAAVLAFVVGRDRSLTYRVVNGAVVEGSRIVAGADTRVRFSDGSEFALAAGAETHIASLDARGGHVSLDHGKIDVDIAKRPGAAWTLAAGPYSVRVTGTAFSLAWSGSDQTFAISMTRGSVIVSGPLVGAGLTLKAGQRLESSVTSGRLLVHDLDAESAPSVASAAPLAAAPATSPPPADTHGTSTEPSRASVGAQAAEAPALSAPTPASSVPPSGAATGAWRKKAASGAFGDVIDAAERRGLEATLATVSLDDLSALADSARYGRRSDLAKRALLAERSRFPHSSTARDAAFFLGRIAEDAGGNASEWYDRYLAESPHGSYASQALGRKMMLAYQQHGAAAARELALEYLERYPKGAYARSAGTIAGEKPLTSPR
jgi:hypothetical protein